MSGRLDGRTAIVTGAGRGIGRAIARTLAREGATVVLAARTAEELEELASTLRREGSRAVPVPADITREEDVHRIAQTALQECGGVDILVNNAGIGVFRNLVDLTPAEFDAMWNVNVRGTFLATRAVLPQMIARGGGDVVTIGSLAGKNTFTGGSGYAATKWALRGMMGSLMLEVREHNIRTLMVFPGSVDTGFSVGGLRGSRVTQPEDVAQAVLFGLTMEGRTMISEIDVRPTRPR